MLKGKLKSKILSLICLAAIIQLFSCEIGLGTAVDVEAPTVDISYPPKNAVVRDSFVVSGECKDDMKISSVSVSIFNSESNKTYGPYKAEVDTDANTWTVTLNKKTPENVTSVFDSYKQWEFPDGSYIISAIATDADGKNSPAASSPISIDNTPPVMIVSKPLAVGNATPTVYGSYFKLSGDVAEDHETTKLSLNYREYDVNSGSFIDSSVRTLEITDSTELNAMSSSNPLLIAQYGNTVSGNHEKYLDIYGSQLGDDKYYYGNFRLEDNAKLYLNPGDEGTGDGNLTQQYYILNENLAVEYSLTPARLKEILKGTSEEYTDAQLSEILTKLSTAGNYASSTALLNSDNNYQEVSSKFSLNPHNNPTWALGEYGLATGETEIAPYTAGSSLVLTLNSGRDASYPDPKTVRVDLYDLGETDSSITGKPVLHLIGPDGIIAESWDESADDSTKTYTFVLDSDSQFEKDHIYQMVVTGTDRNKTDLEPKDSKRYVFRFSTSNNIPRVTITEPEDDFTYGCEVNTSGVTIKGYVNTDSVPLSDTGALSVTRLDISDVSNTIPVNLSIGNYNPDTVSIVEDPEVSHKYNFELKLTAKSNVSFVPDSKSKYLYVATVQAKDRTGLSGDKKVKFYVDNKEPDLTIDNPSPMTEDGFVNGTIRMSGNASDAGITGSGLQSLKYKILDHADNTNVIVPETEITLNEAWNFTILTQSLTNPPKTENPVTATEYDVVVTATDIVGNQKDSTKTITVKQATDKPKVVFTNADDTVDSVDQLGTAKNMFGTVSNNKLYGTVTDDDGITNIKLEYQKTGTTAKTVFAQTELSGVKSYTFEYPLVDPEGNVLSQGEYKIFETVEDTLGETNYAVNESSFFIVVDDGAPVFESVETDLVLNGYNLGSKGTEVKQKTISGTLKDGSGIVTLVRNDNPSNPIEISGDAITGAAWEDTITLPDANGTYTVVYTATDKYNQTSTYEVVYKVDVQEPVINQVIIDSNPVSGTNYTNWIKDNNVNVAVVVRDALSGIGSVYYSLNDGEDYTLMTHSVSEDSDDGEKWIASVSFEDGNNKTLKLLVKDTVTNQKDETINIQVDRTRPVLEVKWYQISDGTPEGTSSFFTPSGISYVSNQDAGKKLIIYANYTDTNETYGEDNSGVNLPEFVIGSNSISNPQITWYKEAFTVSTAAADVMASTNVLSYTEANAKKVKSFKIEIPASLFPNADSEADVFVSGEDKVGNEIENNNRKIITLVNDATHPVVNVSGITKANASGNMVAYKASDTSYFIKRVAGEKLKISGTSTDDNSIDKTVISITGQNGASYSRESTSTAWSFDDIDLSGWDENANPENADATVTITAYDKAGNSTTYGAGGINTISLKFDEAEPALLTGRIDNPDADHTITPSDSGDTSNPYSSDYTLRGKTAWKYGGITIGSGKYGDTSYGRESSIEIGVTYIGERYGSGISKIEYRMIPAGSVPSTVNLTTDTHNGIYTGAMPESGWTRTGDFALTSETYTHYEDPTPRPTYPCVVGKATIGGFENTTNGKPNLLFVRATDNCGNQSDWIALLIQMDSESPEITMADSTPLSLLTNGKSTLDTLSGTVSDGNSSSGLKALRVYIDGRLAIDGNFTRAPAAGLTIVAKDKNGNTLSGWTSDSSVYNEAVEVSLTNDYGTLKYKGFASAAANAVEYSFKDAAAYATWELTLTPQNGSWFDTIKNKSSPQIAIEAEDWAEDSSGSGNKAYVQITTFDIDIVPPTAVLSSPVGNSSGSLNGVHSIKGSVTENHTAEKVEIYYSTESTPPADLFAVDPADSNETSWKLFTTLTSSLYNFDAGEKNFNDFITGDADSGTVHILALVKDKAGNTNVPADSVTDDQSNGSKAYKTYTVDKNSDRPVVTITSANLETNSYENPLQIDTTTINLIVTDDDGIEEVQYRITRDGDTPSESGWTTLNISSSGDSIIRFNNDGKHKLEFRIKDRENEGWFSSNNADPYKRIYLTDMAATPHLYGTDPTLYLKIDTRVPDLTVKKVKLLPTATETADAPDWKTEGFSNLVVGGPSTSFLKVQVEASDEGTGIKNVKISGKLDGESVETITESTSTTAIAEGSSLYEVIIPCTKTGVERENINFVATITAEDNAGKMRSESITFKADTKSPTITITSPLSAASKTHLSGPVTAEGQFSESAKVYYSVSPIEASPDSYTESTAFNYVKYDNSDNEISPAVSLPTNDKSNTLITVTTPLHELCAYRAMDENNPDSQMMSFYLSFDGKTDDTSTGIHSDTLNNWIKKIGITTDEDLRNPQNPFDEMVKLYLHVKAIDSAGNKNELHYPIMLDPLGSRPVVTIGYPSAAQAGEGQELTLGGAPTIIGTATGTNVADYAWLQVDCNADGAWTAADFNILAGLRTSDNAAIYQLGRMDTKELVTEIESGTNVSQYAIRVALSGLNWVQQINKSNELNPAEGSSESTKAVKIWAYATDKLGFISSIEKRNLVIDSQSPVIDQDIKLVQWNSGYNGGNAFATAADGSIAFNDDGSIKFVNGAAAAIRSYNENENIKGKWYVIGKVSDASGIRTISYKVNGGDPERAITDSEALYTGTGAYAGTYIRRISATDKNYVFCLPIGDDTAGSVGEYSIEFTAEEIEDSNPKSAERVFTVRYDNKAPEIDTLLSGYTNGTLAISNSNGVYTFGGVAKEDKVGNIEQTGIERIAFYFTRNISGQATKVFDPMIRSGADGNTVDYSVLGAKEYGLYWQTITVSTAGGTITVPAGSSALKNIHKGGLVKINGVVHKITGVTGNDIGVNDNLGNATGVTAKFAIANIVDNPTRESEGDIRITADYGYGYYSNGTYDDGDLMVESLIQEGTKYTWEANINSKNISDGPATLHYVVFDNAGNTTSEQTIECFIKNNQPRIAGVMLGTDENGNGSVDDGEFVSTYSNIYEQGMNGKNKVSSLTVPANASDSRAQSVFKVKGKTVIKPEIVGGNGTVGYTYSVAKRKLNAQGSDAGEGWDAPYKTPVTSANIKTLGTGTEGDDESTVSLATSGGIVIDVKDFLQNEISDAEKQKFVFTIWDSTPGLVYGSTSQSAVLNVIMDVALNDEAAAKNKIIPFYWKDSEHNSLKDNSTANGHIDLSKDLPAAITSKTPKVSGAFKLEGVAQDNTILSSLTVTINGTQYDIATYASGSWTAASGTGWSTEIREATYEECIAANYISELPDEKEETDSVPFTSQDYGHVVHWTMIIDTEAMGLTPAEDIEISVSALDKGKPILIGTGESATVSYTENDFRFNGEAGATLAAVTQTGGNNGEAAYTCKYNIDVVPYITRIKTKLSEKSKKDDTSEYDRTALGHYPVATTETVKMSGFNLTGSSTSVVKFTSNNANAAEVNYAAAGFAIPANAKSGAVSIVVDGIESYNNKNNNNAQGSYGAEQPAVSAYGEKATYTAFKNFYNRKPNSTNNYTLTDDVEFDIWQLNSTAAKTYAKGPVSDPIMKINPANGVIGFAFQSGTRRFSMAGDSNSYQLWGGDWDNMSSTGFAYDSDGHTYGTALGGDINTSFSVSIFCFYTSLWGPSILNSLDTSALQATKHMRVEEIGQVGTKQDMNDSSVTSSIEAAKYIDKTRVLSPSIAVSGSGNDATVYMAYYDHLNREIRFRWAAQPNSGIYRDPNDTGTGKNLGAWNSTSFINDNYIKGASNNLGQNRDMNSDKYCVKDFQIIAEEEAYDYPAVGAGKKGTPRESTSLGTPGQYVDIAVLPAGSAGNTTGRDVVVMIWYDADSKDLVYTYSKLDFTENTENFVGSAHTKDYWEDPQAIFTDAGLYCKIAVDAAGGIHIAGYDTNSGDIRYAKLSAYDAINSYSETADSCIVDSNGIVGSNLTLDVAYDKAVSEGGKAIPYISYYGNIGPKMAYLTSEGAAQTGSPEGALKDKFTGYWEVTEIPTGSNVPKDRVNVAVWKDNGVIKESTSTIPAVTPTGTTTTATNAVTVGNGTKNPVVGYEIRPTSAVGYMETAQKK